MAPIRRFAANLTFLFTELPILDRFAAAKRAGFTGVEVLFPYDSSASELARAAQRENLEFISMNTPPPNWTGGPRGFAADPHTRDRFRSDLDRALRFARVLRARHIHVMAGRGSGDVCYMTMVENLQWACDRAPHASFVIEPISEAHLPGYFMNSFDLAAKLIKDVDRSNLGMQFDTFHAFNITGDVVDAWQQHCSIVRHIQIAGAPDRHEPSEGLVDHAEFMRAVDATRYPGWVSAEYTPRKTTREGIHWIRPLG